MENVFIEIEITCRGGTTIKQAVNEALKVKSEHPDASIYIKVLKGAG